MEKEEIKNNQPLCLAKKESSFQKFKVFGLIFISVAVGFTIYQFQGLAEKGNGAGIFNILSAKALTVGDFAPDFIAKDVFGNEISLSTLREKLPVLLVFWATWCGYCREELPEIKIFTLKHQNEIRVLAVTSGEQKEDVKNYIEQEAINFLMVLDEDREIWNQYFVRGTPSHFLISSSGKIIAQRQGLASEGDLEMMLTMLPIEP